MGSSGAAALHSALRPKGSRELWCCPGETVYSVGVVSRRHTAAHQRADSGPSLPRTLPAAPRAPAGAWAAAGGAHEGATPTTHPASPRGPALASMAELLEFLSARMAEAALHGALSLLLPLLRPDSARATDAARAVLEHCEQQRAAGEDLPPPLEEVEALLRQHSAWGDAAPAAAGTPTTAAVPPAAGAPTPTLGGPGAAVGAAASAPPGAGGIAAISLAELSRPRPGPRPWASGAHSGSCGSGSGASYSSGSLSSELSLSLSPVIPIGGGFMDGVQLPRTITPPCTNATDRQAERRGGGGAGHGKAPAHARRSPPAHGHPAQGSSSSSSSLEGLLQVPRCVPASAGGRRRPKPNPDPDPNPSPNPELSR